jgi:hypothetical protein
MHCAFYKDGQITPVFETDLPAFPTLSRYAILPLLDDALQAWKQTISEVSDINWDRFAITGMAVKTRKDLDTLKENHSRYVLSGGLTSGSPNNIYFLMHSTQPTVQP